MAELRFNWRLGDFGLRATPKRLVRFSQDEPNETIDFVKYYRDVTGKEYCYSVAYFWWNDKGHSWEFKFVGGRFKEIPDDQIVPIFKMLRAAYDVLSEWKKDSEDDEEA